MALLSPRGFLVVGTLGPSDVGEEQMLFAGRVARLISDSVFVSTLPRGASEQGAIVLLRSVCILIIPRLYLSAFGGFFVIILHLT